MKTRRAAALYRDELSKVYARRDRAFAWLFAMQWVAAILVAVIYSPFAWEAKVRAARTGNVSAAPKMTA